MSIRRLAEEAASPTVLALSGWGYGLSFAGFGGRGVNGDAAPVRIPIRER